MKELEMKELEIEMTNKKSFNLEKEFTSFFLKWLKSKWFFVYKISDSWIWLKPFDIIIHTPNWWYYWEIKIIEKDIFQISQLRENQYTSLKHITTLWWDAIVIVYSKEANKCKIIPFDKIIWLNKGNSIKLIFN